MDIFIPATQTVKVGDETITLSAKRRRVGEAVNIFRAFGRFFGTKPIAYGEVVSECRKEPNAPITPTKIGKRKRNAWRNLYRVKITEIKE